MKAAKAKQPEQPKRGPSGADDFVWVCYALHRLEVQEAQLKQLAVLENIGEG